MKHLPKLTRLIALVFGAIAVSFPLQIMTAYNHQNSEIILALSKLSTLNYLLMVLSVVNMGLVLRLSPWLKFSVPMQLLFVAWNNTIVGYAGLNTGMGAAQAATLLFASFCTIFLFEPFRSLLREPDRRWWLTPARTKIHLSLVANAPLGISFRSKTFDLSKDGLFIELDQKSIKEMFNSITPGTVLDLRIKLNHLQVLPLRACIVRHASTRGRYPAGLGVQFVNLSSYQRRIITELLDKQIPILSAA